MRERRLSTELFTRAKCSVLQNIRRKPMTFDSNQTLWNRSDTRLSSFTDNWTKRESEAEDAGEGEGGGCGGLVTHYGPLPAPLPYSCYNCGGSHFLAITSASCGGVSSKKKKYALRRWLCAQGQAGTSLPETEQKLSNSNFSCQYMHSDHTQQAIKQAFFF